MTHLTPLPDPEDDARAAADWLLGLDMAVALVNEFQRAGLYRHHNTNPPF